MTKNLRRGESAGKCNLFESHLCRFDLVPRCLVLAMRHANVATTMNIYGSSTLRAEKQANSKVVQMVMSQTGQESAA